MAYDPTKPVNNSLIMAAELREQFAGVMEEIQLRPTFAEVSDNIVADSAGSVSILSPLALTVSNPPTQAQVQAIVDALNALLSRLKREP